MELELKVTTKKGMAPRETQLKAAELEVPVIEAILEDYISDLEREASGLYGPLKEQQALLTQTQYKSVNQRIKMIKSALWSIQPVRSSMREAFDRRSNLPKLTLLKFTGCKRDYSEFKRQFLQLTQGKSMEDSIFLAYLRNNLSGEALDSLAGITMRLEAIKILDKRYGDVRTAVSLIKKQLQGLVITKKIPHKQISELGHAVRRAKSELRAFGAEDQLEVDYDLVDSVARKLPQTHLHKWYLYFEDMNLKEDAKENWTLFCDWMDRHKRAAVREKLGDVASGVLPTKMPSLTYQAPVTSGPQVTCSHCKKMGHSTYECHESRGMTMVISMANPEEITPSNVQALTKAEEETIDPCPVCDRKHHYQGKM